MKNTSLILYFDTTSSLSFGVCDQLGEWYFYQSYENSRSISGKFHYLIFEELSKLNLEMTEITHLITCSGPGSYTGMRMAASLSQTFKYAGKNVCSFYHFELPSLLGIRRGIWDSKAYKGEVFVYQWDLDKKYEEKKLVNETLYTEQRGGVNKGLTRFGFEETTKLLKEESKKLIPLIVKRREERPLYYYRSIEEEYIPKREGQ